MIEIARKKSLEVRWTIGDIASMPYEDNTFSGAICVLSIHHFEDLQMAFQELFRVLSRGRLVIFTSDKKQMMGYWLNEYFPQMMKKSIAKMPCMQKVLLALQATGFENIATEKYFVRADLQDLFLYCGKHSPEMYLDPAIRKGSSGFAVFSERDEIESGLKRLSSDIQSGRITEVVKSYQNDDGDYLFISGEKNESDGEV